MIALGWVVSIFQRGAASMKRMQRGSRRREPEIVDPGSRGAATDAPAAPGAIEFRVEGVHFAYPRARDRRCSGGSTSPIRAGETVAIVGRTGLAARPRLVNLVPRLYDPTAGPGAPRRRGPAGDPPGAAARRRSATCPRRPSSSAAPCARTSPWAAPRPPIEEIRADGRPGAPRRGRGRLPPGLRHHGRRARGHPLRRARSSAPPSPGRCCATRRS